MRLLLLLFLFSCCRSSLAQPASAAKTSDTTAYCTMPETVAEYPGGNTALLLFIKQHLFIPDSLTDYAGRIILRFKIDEESRSGTVTVIRSLHPTIDSMAIALIGKMPRWKPATFNGKPKACLYTLPISICPQ